MYYLNFLQRKTCVGKQNNSSSSLCYKVQFMYFHQGPLGGTSCSAYNHYFSFPLGQTFHGVLWQVVNKDKNEALVKSQRMS